VVVILSLFHSYSYFNLSCLVCLGLVWGIFLGLEVSALVILGRLRVSRRELIIGVILAVVIAFILPPVGFMLLFWRFSDS